MGNGFYRVLLGVANLTKDFAPIVFTIAGSGMTLYAIAAEEEKGFAKVLGVIITFAMVMMIAKELGEYALGKLIHW